VFLHDFTKLFFSYKESKKKEFKTVKPYKFIEKNSKNRGLDETTPQKNEVKTA